MLYYSFTWLDDTLVVVCRWYFGKIKRIEAEKKLLQTDNEHGSYLIRDSESRHHDFSLSSEYCVTNLKMRRVKYGSDVAKLVKIRIRSMGILTFKIRRMQM